MKYGIEKTESVFKLSVRKTWIQAPFLILLFCSVSDKKPECNYNNDNYQKYVPEVFGKIDLQCLDETQNDDKCAQNQLKHGTLDDAVCSLIRIRTVGVFQLSVLYQSEYTVHQAHGAEYRKNVDSFDHSGEDNKTDDNDTDDGNISSPVEILVFLHK